MADATQDVQPFNDESFEICDRISAEVMRPLVTQKEFVYIDADVLFDFRLGALLAGMTGESDYNYILSNLQTYLDAPTLACAKFFPDLNKTDEELDAFASDPKYAMPMAAVAPPTKLFEELPVLVRVINSINVSKETQRPVRVTINQRNVLLVDYTKNLIRDAVLRGDANAVVEFTNFPTWKDVPEALLKQQDVIIVHDIKDFLLEGTTSQKLLTTTDELAMTDIMAMVQSDLSLEETELGLANLVNIMELMCNKFSFISKTLLMR